MSVEADKIERAYIPLAEQIDGKVIMYDAAIYDAKIIGVEINGEDTNDDRLVVIVDGCDSFNPRRVKTVYHGKYSAEHELKNRLTDLTIIERLDAKEAERHAVA